MGRGNADHRFGRITAESNQGAIQTAAGRACGTSETLQHPSTSAGGRSTKRAASMRLTVLQNVSDQAQSAVQGQRNEDTDLHFNSLSPFWGLRIGGTCMAVDPMELLDHIDQFSGPPHSP